MRWWLSNRHETYFEHIRQTQTSTTSKHQQKKKIAYRSVVCLFAFRFLSDKQQSGQCINDTFKALAWSVSNIQSVPVMRVTGLPKISD